jgi:ABC-2 type transport system ATP-binding protein
MRVELCEVAKRFGAVQALRAVNLELPAGSRTALIGPNGSGKSTLVRIVMGMLASDGDVRFDGVAVGADRAAIATKLAYVPQVAPRLAAPVRDVIGAIVKLRGMAPQRLENAARALALDLDELARRPFRTLSGGQRQKVLAALALAADAELLLLDEPTASMDPRSRGEFFALVDALPASVSVLLCSHRLDEIRRLVDRVVVMEEGRIAWQGAATEWLADRAEAVVEVSTDGLAAGEWLTAHGFSRGATGWWVRTLPAQERVVLVRSILGQLNGQVKDVMVRDIERLQPEVGPS